MKLIKWIAIVFIIVFNTGCIGKEIKITNCYTFPTPTKTAINTIKNTNNSEVDKFIKELLILKKQIELDCQKEEDNGTN